MCVCVCVCVCLVCLVCLVCVLRVCASCVCLVCAYVTFACASNSICFLISLIFSFLLVFVLSFANNFAIVSDFVSSTRASIFATQKREHMMKQKTKHTHTHTHTHTQHTQSIHLSITWKIATPKLAKTLILHCVECTCPDDNIKVCTYLVVIFFFVLVLIYVLRLELRISFYVRLCWSQYVSIHKNIST